MTNVIQFPMNSTLNPPSQNELVFIHQVPILKQAIYFLNECKGSDGIKLTEKNFLCRKFVQDFWDTFWGGREDQIFRPTRELECPELTRLRFLLSESGLIRKYKSKVILTARGKDQIEHPSVKDLYQDLFNADLFEWNWAYDDRFPEYSFIQDAAPIILKILAQWDGIEITAKQLFDEAFSVSSDSDPEDNEVHFLDPVRCFGLRFLHRFCVPFGILEEAQQTRLLWDTDDIFYKTDFFKTEFLYNFAFETL